MCWKKNILHPFITWVFLVCVINMNRVDVLVQKICSPKYYKMSRSVLRQLKLHPEISHRAETWIRKRYEEDKENNVCL